jgi:CBS-domain-containing membrane protein
MQATLRIEADFFCTQHNESDESTRIIKKGIRPAGKWITDYFMKWKGAAVPSPQQPRLSNSLFAALSCLLTVGGLSHIHCSVLPAILEVPALAASLGASCVLVFGAPHMPTSQPRNVLWGHVLSAAVGVAVGQFVAPIAYELAMPLAVGGSVFLMDRTGTMHPPAGGTALIPLIGSPEIQNLGWAFIWTPMGGGALYVIVCGVVLNNLARDRQYPQRWW